MMATTQDALDSYYDTGLSGGSDNFVVPTTKPPIDGEPSMYDSSFFQTAHDVIFDTLKSTTNGKTAEFIELAYQLGRYGVMIYVLWYGFTVLAMKQRAPVQDFIWNFARFVIILMFVRNIDGWLDASINAIYSLRDTLAGGDVYKWCDQLWVKVVQTASKIYYLDKSTYVPAEGAIGSLLTYIGGLIALLFATIVFFSAEVTLLLLTVTAPLFIMCLMFGFIRQMFNSWLQLIFSALLVFMFGALALRAGTWYLNIILSTNIATASEQNLIYMGASALGAGIFMAFIIWQAKTYASQIAGVGAEGAIQGGVALGLSAATFGATRFASKAMRMGRQAGDGALKGLTGQKNGFKESQGMGGKMGNIAGQGSRAVGKSVANYYKNHFMSK